jgi:hypothetical protein
MPTFFLPNGRPVELDDSEMVSESEGYNALDEERSKRAIPIKPPSSDSLASKIALDGANENDFYGRTPEEIMEILGQVPGYMDVYRLENEAQKQKKDRDAEYQKQFGLGYLLPSDIIEEKDLGKGEADPRLHRELGNFDPHMIKLIQMAAEEDRGPVAAGGSMMVPPFSTPKNTSWHAPAGPPVKAMDTSYQGPSGRLVASGGGYVPLSHDGSKQDGGTVVMPQRPTQPGDAPNITIKWQNGKYVAIPTPAPAVNDVEIGPVEVEKTSGLSMLREYLKAKDLERINQSNKTALMSAISPGTLK